MAFSGTAFAGDLPTNNWNGFYVGINGGYGNGNSDVNYSPNDPASAALFLPNFFTNDHFMPSSVNVSGGFGGFQLGYNFQFARTWLVGLEADFDWSGIKGANSVFNGAGFISISNNLSQNIDSFGTVRARIGSIATENLLIFATGGFAYGREAESGNYVGIGPAGAGIGHGGGVFGWNCTAPSVCWTGSSSSMRSGWTAGAGFEYAIFKNVTLKAEYLYISFDGKSVTEANLQPTPGLLTSSVNASFGTLALNIVRAGLNYRF